MTSTPPWLEDNPTERRPTEILVPLVTKVGPVWYHSDNRGGWYAGLEVAVPSLQTDPIWECDHFHATSDEAWECANGAAMQVAEELTGPRS